MKKYCLILIGIVVLSGLFLYSDIIQAATSKAIHIRIDANESEMFRFYGCSLTEQNFYPSQDYYTTGGITYNCPIFITEEDDGPDNDNNIIMWVEKGSTIKNSNSYLSHNISYVFCPDQSSPGCELNTDGLGWFDDIEVAKTVATKQFGPITNLCDNCSLSISNTEYRPRYDLNCTASGWQWTIPSCTDTDGAGKNYNTKGTCVGGNGTFTDYCEGSQLTEYYCDNALNNRCNIANYNCALDESGYTICEDGACIRTAEVCSQPVKIVDYDTGQGLQNMNAWDPSNHDIRCLTDINGKCNLTLIKNNTYTIEAHDPNGNLSCPNDGSCWKEIQACTSEITLKLKRPTCRWQEIDCGGSTVRPCQQTERLYTCGPPGCTGGDCVDGQWRCVSDPVCQPSDTCYWQRGSCGHPCEVGKRLYTCGPRDCEGGVCREGEVDCRTDSSCTGVCSYQNDRCGDAPCMPTQMHQTCGPVGCTPSYACDEGQTKCVFNSECSEYSNGDNGDNGDNGYVPSPITNIKFENPIVAESFETVINNIIDFLFKIAIVLVPLMVVIGGIMFLTSAGNLERVTQSKRILIWSLVGFLIILLSKGILAMLESLLTKE